MVDVATVYMCVCWHGHCLVSQPREPRRLIHDTDPAVLRAHIPLEYVNVSLHDFLLSSPARLLRLSPGISTYRLVLRDAQTVEEGETEVK